MEVLRLNREHQTPIKAACAKVGIPRPTFYWWRREKMAEQGGAHE